MLCGLCMRPATGVPHSIALEGPSGSGKTTLARALGDRLGWPVLAEAYRRRTGPRSIAFATKRELVQVERRLVSEDFRRFRETKKILASGEGVILDTDFLGPLTYSWGLRENVDPRWDAVLEVREKLAAGLRKKVWGLADFYLYLDVPNTIIARRLNRSTASHPRAFRDRHAQVGVAERAFFLHEFPRLAPRRILRWKGRRPVAQAVPAILGALERIGPVRPATPSLAARVLRFFDTPPETARSLR
jgi:thymidylate kinase